MENDKKEIDSPVPFKSSKTEILRRRQVMARTGMGRTTIYERTRNGDFPKPVRLGAKIVGWIEAEVEAWLGEQVKKSRGGA